MKAVAEIGLIKSLRYLAHTLFLSLFSHGLISPFRIVLLRLAGVKVGQDSVIHAIRFFNTYHKGFSTLTIGKYVFLGDEVMFDMADAITLGDHVTISSRVTVLTHTNVGYSNHPLQKYFPKFNSPVHIESGSFIGAGVIILPGVTIGKESFVAAGSVVTKNVGKKVLVAGVPAKVVRKIT